MSKENPRVLEKSDIGKMVKFKSIVDKEPVTALLIGVGNCYEFRLGPDKYARYALSTMQASWTTISDSQQKAMEVHSPISGLMNFHVTVDVENSAVDEFKASRLLLLALSLTTTIIGVTLLVLLCTGS